MPWAGTAGSARAAGSARSAVIPGARTAGTTRAAGVSGSARPTWAAGSTRAVFPRATGTARATRTGTTWATGPARSWATGPTRAAGIIWAGRSVNASGPWCAMAAGARSGISQTGAHTQGRCAKGAGECPRRNQLLQIQIHISPHLIT